jgi:PEP-CTERM motif
MRPRTLGKSRLGDLVRRTKSASLMLAVLTWTATPVTAAPVVFEAGGTDATSSIQATVDAFRAALGSVNNGNNPGPLFSGRREINWDGGGNTNTPSATPLDAFLNIRGARFTTAGAGFIQAPPSGGANGGLAAAFVNATYGDIFGVFSSPRVFTPVDSNITDVLFFIPGTNGGTQAEVSGFGAVFTDVDLASSTKIDFFDRNGSLLTEQFVPAGTVANKSLSFLGVIFSAGEEIARVRITSGNATLSTSNNDGLGTDLVVMDDFLYSEPRAVPEPASWALFGAAAAALMGVRRWRSA